MELGIGPIPPHKDGVRSVEKAKQPAGRSVLSLLLFSGACNPTAAGEHDAAR
jgi:hypothetical protein